MTVTTTTDASEVGGDGNITVSAWVDPADVFPEGVGSGDEFTNANNGPIFEDTFFDVP